MREILFRGKWTYNGKWVAGYFIKCPSAIQIGDYSPWRIYIPPKNPDDISKIYDVFTNTVGQYTGRKDKNGVRIFEGDIVQVDDMYIPQKYVVCMDSERRGWFPFACGDGCGCCEEDTFSPQICEIIGNIHDNPELLKYAEASTCP